MNPVETVQEWVGRVQRQIEPYLSFEGDERRDDGQQLRLDLADVRDRLPARHRQALPGQPDAGARGGAQPARERHQLHRVQLRAPAVPGLPRAVPHARRAAPVRRQRPVGQPHRGRRADPAGHRRAGPRVRDAAGHQGRRHEVRQVRGRGALARPRACCRRTPSTSSGSTSRTSRWGSCCGSSRSSPREEIEELEQQTAEKPFLRAGQKRLAEEVTSFVHGREETERIRAASAALFGGGDLRTLDAAHAGRGAARGRRWRGGRRATDCRRSSTCSSRRGCRRAGGRHAGRSPRAAPT